MNPRKKVDLKLIIIGALGVGKTSLLHRYVHKTFYEDYQTTLGASILSKIIILEDTTLKLQIWDTGGQERFRSMVSTFYKGSDGCVLAFDVTDLESFEALETWRGDVLAKTIPMEQPYPMVVLGNKIDLEDRQVPQEVAQGWCKEKDIPYFEVSAKNDINVVQAFEMLASRALSRQPRILGEEDEGGSPAWGGKSWALKSADLALNPASTSYCVLDKSRASLSHCFPPFTV
uniref:Ras-related protein Rab-7b n=1 Tax=Bos taurus TaxID=9913 RepID=A0AAA9TUX9_BOVIN